MTVVEILAWIGAVVKKELAQLLRQKHRLQVLMDHTPFLLHLQSQYHCLEQNLAVFKQKVVAHKIVLLVAWVYVQVKLVELRDSSLSALERLPVAGNGGSSRF
jgi:hypothetical protein